MAFSLDALFHPRPLARALSTLERTPEDPLRTVRARRLLWALLGVAVIGLFAILTSLLRGHKVMGTTSEVPWGVLIATYVFFVASASGLCIVSSLGHVWGFKLFEPLAKKATFLALVMLVVGFTVIASELERPFRLVLYAVISPNPTSPIWWMGALYGMYMLLLVVELYFLIVEDHSKARFAGTLSFFAAIAAQSNLGAVFGLSHGRPAWYGSFPPLQFIVLAMVSGTALLVLLVYLEDAFTTPDGALKPENAKMYDALRKLLALFLGVSAFFTVWKVITFLNGGHSHLSEVMKASLTGPFFLSFWVFEIFLGLLVPLVLLLGKKRESTRAVAFAAAMPLLGIFVMRFNFVLSGQMMSLRPLTGHAGQTMVYQPPFKGSAAGFLPYTPSIVEMLIVAGAVAAAVLVYSGGQRALRLEPVPEGGHS